MRTICVLCKFYEEDINLFSNSDAVVNYLCMHPSLEIDQVTGEERVWNPKCKEINNNGECPLYVFKHSE